MASRALVARANPDRKGHEMKITGIRTFIYEARWRNWLFVKVDTDEGITGLGEASLQGLNRAVEVAVHNLEQEYFIGKDPRQIQLHWANVYRDSWWHQSHVPLAALSGIEIALWDILGKSLNAPIYQLLGGASRDRIKVYNNSWYFDAKSVDEFAERAKEAVALGFRALKWDPFWDPPLGIINERAAMLKAVECVRRVREAVGDDIELLIEVHARLGTHDAIWMARELEQYRPFWFEEPIPPDNLEALAKVASEVNIPITTGEKACTRWGFREMLERQMVSMIMPDIICAGGILETIKIAAMADVYHIGVAPHSCVGPGLTAASLHVDAVIPNFLIQELFYPDKPLYDEILTDDFPILKDGYVELPTKPGLGIDINEAAIQNRPFKHHPSGGHLWKSLTRMGE